MIYLISMDFRFFTKQQGKDLIIGERFDILDIREANVEPVTPYLVYSRKT